MATRIILSDEHCGKHAENIYHALARLGYIELLSLEFKVFDEVGLYQGANDERVWRFCQDNGYLLLTGNRTAKDGHDSLEFTVRRLVQMKAYR